MKLQITSNPFGPKFTCIDSDEYDGAPDAGPQLVGQGDTEEEAKEDFYDQRLERQATNGGSSKMSTWERLKAAWRIAGVLADAEAEACQRRIAACLRRKIRALEKRS
jgi:hypothetical protein